MPTDNWADLAKDYFLYQSQRGGSIELMLQRTLTNSRVNEAMSRWIMAVGGITRNWHGNYKDLFGNIHEELQEQYMNLEAFGRKQAIELAAAIAKANAVPGMPPEQEKKRGGLLGLFR
jgi:hypothetical protein